MTFECSRWNLKSSGDGERLFAQVDQQEIATVQIAILSAEYRRGVDRT